VNGGDVTTFARDKIRLRGGKTLQQFAPTADEVALATGKSL